MSLTLSGLGTLCQDLFKCNSCASSCAPNCMRTVTVIVVEHPGQDKGVLPFLNDEQNLEQILKTVHQQKTQVLPGIKVERVHHLSSEATPDQRQSFQAAILDITLQFFQTMSNPSIPDAETWAKFRAACAISKVDLEKKYDSGNAITSQEYRQLQKGINKVCKFWDLAFYLWLVTCENKVDWDVVNTKSSEKTELITRKQAAFLKKELEFVEKKRVINKWSFSELDRNILLAFLKASFMFSKHIQTASHLQSTLTNYSVQAARRREVPLQPARAYGERGIKSAPPMIAPQPHRAIPVNLLQEGADAELGVARYERSRALRSREGLEDGIQTVLQTKWSSAVMESPSAPIPPPAENANTPSNLQASEARESKSDRSVSKHTNRTTEI